MLNHQIFRSGFDQPSVLRIAVAVLCTITAFTSCSTTTPYGEQSTEQPTSQGTSLSPNATVDRVIDGDTIVVTSHGERERIRMIGVNTPESVHPTKPVECFGKEASAHTASLLPKGTPVHLARDVELRDRYGRLLAYVYRSSDGLFINVHLVREGFGASNKFPPNTALSAQFSQAQSTAKESSVGMWSACSPTGGGN